MLGFHVKFVQTDRRTNGRTDNVKTILPIFRYGGIKILFVPKPYHVNSFAVNVSSNTIFGWLDQDQTALNVQSDLWPTLSGSWF